MAEQKDATGITTVAPSYEEAVRQTAARRVAIGEMGVPMPDTPHGTMHLNPAINPAPPKVVLPDRIPVPVINDPGLVGANPPLHDLNRQYRADLLGAPVDDSQGLTMLAHQEAISVAAKATQDDVAARAKEQRETAVSDAVEGAKAAKLVADTPKAEPVKPASDMKPVVPAPAPKPLDAK